MRQVASKSGNCPAFVELRRGPNPELCHLLSNSGFERSIVTSEVLRRSPVVYQVLQTSGNVPPFLLVLFWLFGGVSLCVPDVAFAFLCFLLFFGIPLVLWAIVYQGFCLGARFPFGFFGSRAGARRVRNSTKGLEAASRPSCQLKMLTLRGRRALPPKSIAVRGDRS